MLRQRLKVSVLRKTIHYLKYPAIKLLTVVALLTTACSGSLTPSATEPVATEPVVLSPSAPDEPASSEPNHIDAALYLQRASGKDLRFERTSVEQGTNIPIVSLVKRGSCGPRWNVLHA